MEFLQKTGLLHGGDYNPDQWLDKPEILEEDIRLMQKAHVNCVTLGVFAWAALEPEEGTYETEWLEKIISHLYENKIFTILATPTGAMPPWMTQKYEEVMQTEENGLRRFPGNRHNFCPSSPVMRRKMREINRVLSKRLGNHPGVIAWHISNEYGGNGRAAACHCPRCQEAFRTWLKDRYQTLEALNASWWTSFWSHTYSDWSQIRSASPRGEDVLNGLKLDWKRFVSHQLLDFCKEEIRAVREYSKLPVTTNMMGFYKPLDYFKWAKELDIISWDCYPDWHSGQKEYDTAADAAAGHCLMRSLKKSPFLVMECTPSLINWRPVNRCKRPGMHALSSLQAIAHGADSVLYFQWRKSRGSCEQFHGAVVDHKNSSNTRVFRDVTEVGSRLAKLSEKVAGTCNRARVAIIFDWENRWALEDAYAVDNNLCYQDVLRTYFKPLWELGVDTDIIDMDGDLEEYAVVIAPLNYMYRGDYVEKVRRYVKEGGCYVTTYWSGEVDESGLCFLEEHPLRQVLGIRTEETDTPGGYCRNYINYAGKNYEITGICSLVHAESASILAEYQNDFYRGMPALTQNRFGKGNAYYIASENEPAFLKELFGKILKEAGVSCTLAAVWPEGVTVSERTGESGTPLWFVQNFNREQVRVSLEAVYQNAETEKRTGKILEMPAFSCVVLEKCK